MGGPFCGSCTGESPKTTMPRRDRVRSAARVRSAPDRSYFSGSWINANFDVWIGAEEDNNAWEYLLRARQTYDDVSRSAERAAYRKSADFAYEELLIAEGSDWSWWYGPEHDSANRPSSISCSATSWLMSTPLSGYPAGGVCPGPPESDGNEFHQPPTGPVKATWMARSLRTSGGSGRVFIV